MAEAKRIEKIAPSQRRVQEAQPVSSASSQPRQETFQSILQRVLAERAMKLPAGQSTATGKPGAA